MGKTAITPALVRIGVSAGDSGVNFPIGPTVSEVAVMSILSLHLASCSSSLSFILFWLSSFSVYLLNLDDIKTGHSL